MSTKPVIESWHGYKNPDTGEAEVVLVGTGFGTTIGSVKLNVQGTGKVDALILSWTDTSIVVSAPVDEVIRRVHVYTLDSRGQEKQSAQSPAPGARSTEGNAAPWAVTATDDDLDTIDVEGTDLDEVVDVFLFDSSLPQQVYAASFLLNGADLEIDWPPSFVGPITKMRLSDAGGGHVTEVLGGAGWTPAANGVIENVTTQLAGQAAILNLIGSGFGAGEGAVSLRKVGGQLEDAGIVAGGWSDSVVQVIAETATTYDLFELTREDGEVADLGPSVPATITTPGSQAAVTLTDFYQIGTLASEGYYKFRAVGTGLDTVARLNMGMSSGSLWAYNPAIWGAAADGYNAGNFINVDPTFDPGAIEFWLDAAAVGYVGGKTVLGILAATQSGQPIADLTKQFVIQ